MQRKRWERTWLSKIRTSLKKKILNGSAIPPCDTAAQSPTNFYQSFLAKKTQFKAKDMLVHQLQTDKIAFYPNSIFVANRWNCDFYWILPDSPSGISIFYCPESKSLNAYELEKERNLSSVDKIKNTDIEKLTKQKIHLPTTVMDLIWMTQNF